MSEKSSSSVLWEADPFIEAAEDLQESVDKLEEAFYMWRGRQEVDSDAPVESGSSADAVDAEVTSLLSICDSVRMQVGDFHKAVSAMTRNPEQFFLSGDELGRRFEFVKSLNSIESAVRYALLTGNYGRVPERNAGLRALNALLGGQHRGTASPARIADREPLLPSSIGVDIMEAAGIDQAVQARGFPHPKTAVQAIAAVSVTNAVDRLKRNLRCIVLSASIAGVILWAAAAFGGS